MNNRMSMEGINQKKLEKMSETQNVAVQASRIETGITEFYKILEALPDGLDQEISDQIEDARDAAREEAGKDGDELVTAQQKTNKEFESLCEMATAKIKDNATAVEKLKSIRTKYGRTQILSAITEINANTEKGEYIISDAQRALMQIDEKLAQMRQSINKNKG